MLSGWGWGHSRKGLGREPEETLCVAKPGEKQTSSRAPRSVKQGSDTPTPRLRRAPSLVAQEVPFSIYLAGRLGSEWPRLMMLRLGPALGIALRHSGLTF